METTTGKTAKPYEGTANTPAIIALAKRSAHVRYRPRGEYRSRSGVSVTVGGRGRLAPADYGKRRGNVNPTHAVTEIRFSNIDTDNFAAAAAGFETELTAAGWHVIKQTRSTWVVVGPLWEEWMRGAYDTAVADKIAAEDRNAKAVREAKEITRLLASRGVTGKYVENYGSARVTLYLADIEKLMGVNHDDD